MAIAPPAPSPGELVHLRQRRYLVEEAVPPPEPGDATLVRLSCVDDDAQGQPLDVFWECEVDPEVLEVEAWGDLGAKGFDDPKHFAAYVHAVRWNAVTAADPRLFQSPFRAGIRLDAYQLEPLRKALLLPRVNLFIADDVGLGKTIQRAPATGWHRAARGSRRPKGPSGQTLASRPKTVRGHPSQFVSAQTDRR